MSSNEEFMDRHGKTRTSEYFQSVDSGFKSSKKINILQQVIVRGKGITPEILESPVSIPEHPGLPVINTPTQRSLRKRPHKFFECDNCSYKTEDPNTLVEHKTILHYFICDICGCTTANESFFEHYLIVPEKKRPRASLLKRKLVAQTFSCIYCKEIFAKKSDLTQHWKTHSPNSVFVCPACGEKYFSKLALQQHLKGHPKKHVSLMKTIN